MDFIRRARAVLNLGNSVVVAALITTLSVMGCGGGAGGGDTPIQASYVGNWYQASSDAYLEIKTDNTVVLRVCSATGYKAAATGLIDGDSLSLSSSTFPMIRDGDSLTLVGPNAETVIFTLAGTIPSVCLGNFIEITSVGPTTATANVPTLFTVNFDYQLATQDNGIVYLGFNTSSADGFTLTSSTLTVTRGTGSGSLTSSVAPIVYPSPDSFAAYVNLSEDPHPPSWTPLSSDFEPIVVMQGNGVSPGIVRNKATNKRQGMSVSGWSCGSGAIDSCAMLLP